MRLLDARNTSYICLPLHVYSDYIVCYLPRIVDDKFLIPIVSRPRSMLHQYPNVWKGLKHTSAPTFDMAEAPTSPGS